MARTPDDRLREQLDALVGMGVPEDVRGTHRRAITAHATSLGPAAAAGAAGGAAGRGRRTPIGRRVVALGSLGALVVPGVAVAAQGAVPGDALFGVKRATEIVTSVVDERSRATNRLAELGTFLERDAGDDVLLQALDAATEAVLALDGATDLEARLSLLGRRVTEVIAARHELEDAASADGSAGTPGLATPPVDVPSPADRAQDGGTVDADPDDHRPAADDDTDDDTDADADHDTDDGSEDEAGQRSPDPRDERTGQDRRRDGREDGDDTDDDDAGDDRNDRRGGDHDETGTDDVTVPPVVVETTRPDGADEDRPAAEGRKSPAPGRLGVEPDDEPRGDRSPDDDHGSPRDESAAGSDD